MNEWWTTLPTTLDQVWQRLSRGVADRRAFASHPTLATTGDAGPEARIVVLRQARGQFPVEGWVMFRACAVVAFVFVLVTPAVADAIDGDWCGGKGLHLTIKGPEITTPSGVTLKGNYDRHEFAYTAPPGDGDAGMQIYLKLLSEDFMNFYHVKDGKPGEPELWRRCNVTS